MGLRDIFNKVIGRYEEGANYKLGQSLSASAVATIMGTGGDAINVIEEYNGFAWKAINVRAMALSAEDLYVERMVGKKWQADEAHEFNYVLEGSEGQRDLSELLEAHSKSMDLYGESFWYFSKGEQFKKPMGVYLLDPSAMTVMVADNRVTGYIYQKDGVHAAMDLDEVLHRRTEDPRSPFRGYGAMQAAGWFIRSNRYLYTYMNNFMDNNSIPAGVVVAKGSVSDEDWKLFKNQWSNKYGGIENSGKTGFVRGEDLSFVKTGMSLGDVDFEKLKNSSRDDIMIMFGVSKPMMAIFDDINRASAVTARQLFATTYVKPELKSLSRKLTKKVNSWYGKEYRVNSTDPVPEDEDAKLTLYEKGVGRWVTVNEARQAYSLEPIAGGDELKEVVQPAPKSLDKVKIKLKTNTQASFSYEMKESYRSKVEDLQKSYESKFAGAIRPVLIAQKEFVIDQLRPKKVVDAHMVAEEEAVKLEVALTPLFIELAKEQGQMSLEMALNDTAKFVLSPVVEKYIRDSVAQTTLAFTMQTQEKIATALKDGLEAGDSIAKIAKAISGIYDEQIPPKSGGYDKAWRSERFARTEVIKTSNEIAESAYKQSGVVSKKEWFANPGHCQFCASLNGSVIQLGSIFVGVGDNLEGSDGGTRKNDYEDVRHPPVHSNCRCTLIPVIEG